MGSLDMSDTSQPVRIPSDAALERALRRVVQQVYKKGNLEELTVRRVRKAAEEELDLETDFFKNDKEWKEKSKAVIESEVEAHSDANASTQQCSPPEPHPKHSPSLPPKPENGTRNSRGSKRASTEAQGPKKRQKTAVFDEVDLASDTDPRSRKKLSAKVKDQSPSSSPSSGGRREGEDEKVELQSEVQDISTSNGVSKKPADDEMSEVFDETAKIKDRDRKLDKVKPNMKEVKPKGEKPRAEQSESDMSEVLDETPQPKRTSVSTKAKTKKADSSKVKKASEKPMDPEAEEIKRLQGWLVKCGIRKMWFKELAPYDTSKAKVRHLKDMLTEAGMTGRYSEQKAAQIKEERELKADLEAVREGDKRWGQAQSGEELNGENRPRRKLAKGLEGLDFLNDDDGEETD